MDRVSAAGNALLIMYAWDMCDASLHDIPPKQLDPRMARSGWNIVGFLSGSDDIIRSGAGIRSSVLGASDDAANRVCYGYVAEQNGQVVAVIRGTDGAEEWCDDLDFLMMAHPNPAGGLVDQGFWSIYRTMWFHPVAGGSNPGIAEGITAAAAGKPVRVLGHSLGAALGTYLALDLKLAGCAASACLFASPRTGNGTFVSFFDRTVNNYDLFNYARDIVPTVPQFDVLHLSNYADLPQAKTIPPDASVVQITNEIRCNHHLICYTALLDMPTYRQAMADPACTDDDRNCAKCVLLPA